jgi:hypothetical protein
MVLSYRLEIFPPAVSFWVMVHASTARTDETHGSDEWVSATKFAKLLNVAKRTKETGAAFHAGSYKGRCLDGTA